MFCTNYGSISCRFWDIWFRQLRVKVTKRDTNCGKKVTFFVEKCYSPCGRMEANIMCLWTTWYTSMNFIFITYQQYQKNSSSKLHALYKRWVSACSLCILPPSFRRTPCGKVRNTGGHVVWRHGQSLSRRTFYSAFYLPHSAVPHITHSPLLQSKWT